MPTTRKITAAQLRVGDRLTTVPATVTKVRHEPEGRVWIEVEFEPGGVFNGATYDGTRPMTVERPAPR